ncbi:chaperonin 10-like protein [Baffinella frigidus]|nr:chaperonin 10-like protein [Cryptophyta sp. CCMP2293]
MQAARLSEDGRLIVNEVPIPQPGPGWARLQILQAGICNTDLELRRGYKGGFSGTLGHEFVARVHAVNPSPEAVPHVAVGQRVVAEINCVPGGCGCRGYHERAQHPARSALGIFGADGGFAEYLIVPIENIHLVPESLTDDQAMFAEPLAAACQITQQVHVRASQKCAVLGTGKLGVLISQVLAHAGCAVTAAGRREVNFEFLQARGITTALAPALLAQKDEPASDL